MVHSILAICLKDNYQKRSNIREYLVFGKLITGEKLQSLILHIRGKKLLLTMYLYIAMKQNKMTLIFLLPFKEKLKPKGNSRYKLGGHLCRSIINVDCLLDAIQALVADCDHAAIRKIKNVDAFVNRCKF